VAIQVLGPIELDGGDELRPRDRLVLGALAVRRDQVVAPDEIADAVWGDEPPASWRKQVQICVARLRKVLGPNGIESTSGGYRLRLAHVQLDSEHFEALVARGRSLARNGEPDRSAVALARALSAWRGPPFAALDGWAPARTEAHRLSELHRSAEEELLDARLATGEHRAVAVQAEALVAAEPLREARWAALALAQYRCGRQGDALATLRRARDVLATELGVDPGPELIELEAAILAQDDSLRSVPVARTVSRDCPYKGLAFLDVGDSLFGRDDDIEACLQRLRDSPLLVVAGASGCGKSSLLRAGLVPALTRSGRPAYVLVPGPAGELAFPRPPGVGRTDPVLVVDQLEGLFTAAPTRAQAAQTCAALAAYANERAPVVVAMRADHLAELAADPSFSELAEKGLVLLRTLTGSALREAIERPAHEAGLRIEDGLVELVIRDSDGEPGALPLMSHALAETWLRHDGGVLTVEAYRAAGGIQGAVARSADRLHDSLQSEERTVLRSVLLRLVSPSPDGDPLRARVAADALRGDLRRERVLRLLISARLVTVADGIVELSHEALVRAWPRLSAWLEDDMEGLRVLRHLSAAAAGWESLGRPDTELYRGPRLDMVLEYRQRALPDLTTVEQHFLDKSVLLADSERAQMQRRAQTDAARAHRLRTLLGVAVSLLLVSLITGLVAVDQAREATGQRDRAASAGDRARLQALVNRSLALRSTDRDVAALLAVEAARRWPDRPEAMSALLGGFTTAPGFAGYQFLPHAEQLTGALVPGTRTALVAVADEGLTALDVDSGKTSTPFPALPPNAGSPKKVVVSADGRVAALLLTTPTPDGSCPGQAPPQSTGVEACGALWFYNLASRTVLAGPVFAPTGPGDLAINDDGSRVAVAGGHAGVTAVFDSRGRLQGMLPGLRRPPAAEENLHTAAVGFGSDGLLRVGSLAGPIRTVDPDSLRTLATAPAPPFSTHQHVSPGRDGLVVAGGSEAVVATRPNARRAEWTLDLRGTNPDPCPWFADSRVSDRVYCGSNYGEIEEFVRSTGQRTGVTLDPQKGGVGSLAVSQSGDELVAFGAEIPAVSRWRLDGSGPVTKHIADGHVLADGFDFDGGTTLLVAARGPRATIDTDFDDPALWDPVTDRVVDHLKPVTAGAGWVGDGLLVGVAPDQKHFAWYDVEKRAAGEGPDLGLDCDHIWATAGGERAYCGFADGTVATIDVARRERIEPTIKVDGFPWSVSATNGGAQVVITAWTDSGPETTVHDGDSGAQLGGVLKDADMTSVSLDGVLVGARAGDITRYDLKTLKPMTELPGARGEVNSLQFSEDGSVLLATSNDQTASVYDIASGIRIGDPIQSSAPFLYPAFLRHDGKALAVTDLTGVAMWDLDPDHLREAACRVAGRDLTRREWDTYLGDLGTYRSTCSQ
jgi:DNA-binding SARP family transcriptional activator/WD40 repeat protein